MKRTFALGDGRFSSGSPVRPPQLEQQEGHPPHMRAGTRVWVFRGGEWTENVLREWSQGHTYVVPLHDQAAEPRPTLPRFLACEQPSDCGALVPPAGLPGIMWWLERDVTVFANMPGVGAAVPRPRVLWE